MLRTIACGADKEHNITPGDWIGLDCHAMYMIVACQENGHAL